MPGIKCRIRGSLSGKQINILRWPILIPNFATYRRKNLDIEICGEVHPKINYGFRDWRLGKMSGAAHQEPGWDVFFSSAMSFLPTLSVELRRVCFGTQFLNSKADIGRSDKAMEPRGFEPLTSSMPLRRSTN